MSGISPALPPLTPSMPDATAAAARSGDPSQAKQTASDFESLLIAQMLRGARSAEQGWLGTGEDQTAGSLIEMAEEHLAKSLSAAGGLGLASLVIQGLAADQPPGQPQQGEQQQSGSLAGQQIQRPGAEPVK